MSDTVKVVFKAADALPLCARAVGCKDIDDFMYLKLGDFDAELDVITAST